MKPLILIWFAVQLLSPISTLPSGAPESACSTLTPIHANIERQATPSPYRITPYTSRVGQGQTLALAIESNPQNLGFGGFMLHAVNVNNPNEVVGRFEEKGSSVKLINCNGVNNTATHMNPLSKNNLELEWTAPDNFNGEVIFRGTVAQDYSNFWVGIESRPVQIGAENVPGISTTRQPQTTTTPRFEPKQLVTNSDAIYEGCGSTRKCVGFPEGCVSSKSCLGITAVYLRDGRYLFELLAIGNSTKIPAYIAFGLSDDTRMGDDSVIECVPENGGINAYTSYTTAPAYGSGRDGVPQDIIRLLDSTYADGAIHCLIERQAISDVRGKRFDLDNDKYHMLLALGEDLKMAENSVGYHTIGRVATEMKELLSISSATDGDSIYDNCNISKKCIGFPDGCLLLKSCLGVVAITNENGRFLFDLEAKGNAEKVPAYIAFGLSDDVNMGDDSVIECVPENGIMKAYTSYTTAPAYGSGRDSIPQNIIQLLESSFVDGTIRCRIERDVISNVRGRRFDLDNDHYHFMLALGETLKAAENSVGYHSIGRIVTAEKLQLSQVADVYDGCNESKKCIGFPENCLSFKTCLALAAISVQNNRYIFDLHARSGSQKPAYVALGLSADNKMGDDSVIECVPENGIIKAYTSYTTAPAYGSGRNDVSQNIIQLLDSSYVDGTINCKIERQTVSEVRGQQFDLAKDEYHLLLALGEDLKVAENSVGYHSIGRIASNDKQLLTDIVMPTPPNTPNSGDPMYDGCSDTKGCFGLTDNCVRTKTCAALAVVHVEGERYQFELQALATAANKPAYVAIGLSDDNKMGDDSVIECVAENGEIKAYTSYTQINPYGSPRTGINQNIVRLLDSSFIDGTIYCKFERQTVSEVLGKKFDLINSQYHLLLAVGDSLKSEENSVGYHSIGRIASSSPQFLADTAEFKGASVLLLRLHGAFMLIAWIGTASLGIIFARYFKQTWVGNKLCGLDQWFVWHRVFMVLTWLLTIAAFVIIFVEIGGLSSNSNPHIILGIITTVICFLQPIGALFRPAPGSKNRPIFNWIHWLGGNVAHILAIATIFYAVQLTKAELPQWMDWILVAFVLFHVLMHIVLSIGGCISDNRSGKRVTAFPMTDLGPRGGAMNADRKQDAPHATFRKVLLGLYIIIITLFVVALVLIAVLAPIEDSIAIMKTN